MRQNTPASGANREVRHTCGLVVWAPVRRPTDGFPAERRGHLIYLAFVTRHIVSPAMSCGLSHIGRQQSRGHEANVVRNRKLWRKAEAVSRPSYRARPKPTPDPRSGWYMIAEIPSVAIGGITPENSRPLIKAGADFIAVCRAVWGSENPGMAVAEFMKVFEE